MNTRTEVGAGGGVDWYERRHDLCGGMMFRTSDGTIVQLDRTVPGDGTKWYAATWHGSWSYEDYTIEPGDLTGPAFSDIETLLRGATP